MTAISLFQQLQWWQVLLLLLALALFPLVRAVAVVFVARRVDAEIAKIAIPLILRKPHFLFWQKLSKIFTKTPLENNEKTKAKREKNSI